MDHDTDRAIEYQTFILIKIEAENSKKIKIVFSDNGCAGTRREEKIGLWTFYMYNKSTAPHPDQPWQSGQCLPASPPTPDANAGRQNAKT